VESSAPSITLAQSFAELADESARTEGLHIRIERADGSRIEGSLLSVEQSRLTVVDDATQDVIPIAAAELRALEVQSPRRGREWLLAGLAILGATAALIGYATLPWVRPTGESVTAGFVILYLAAAALFSRVLARTGLRRWLTQWRQLYPPRGA
jgi:hypothetical protein